MSPRCILCCERSAGADDICDVCHARPICADCRTAPVATLYDCCAACRAASAARFERTLDEMAGSDPDARARMTRMLADGIEFPGYVPGEYLPVERTTVAR